MISPQVKPQAMSFGQISKRTVWQIDNLATPVRYSSAFAFSFWLGLNVGLYLLISCEVSWEDPQAYCCRRIVKLPNSAPTGIK